MVRYDFDGHLIEWRGPAPFHFIAVPEFLCPEIKEAARVLSYGWGVVPVVGTIGVTEFTTSLIPRHGGFLLPVKDTVRKAEALNLGQEVNVTLQVGGTLSL